MSAPIAPFIPDRFSSTVPFYVEGRLNYPPRLIENVASWLGISPKDHVLDLGCGPGFLAIAFAKLGCTVTAIDPDRAMLAAGRELAAREGVSCSFQEGSSYDIGPALGRFKLVTMGRSFHWMDRPATLSALDRLVAEDGAIALFNDDEMRAKENRWVEALDEVRRRFERVDEFRASLKAGEVERHEIVLLASAFSRLENMGVIERRKLTAETALARALSYSSCSPEKLGERRPEFEGEVQATLSPFAVDGTLTQIVRFTALIARRPG